MKKLTILLFVFILSGVAFGLIEDYWIIGDPVRDTGSVYDFVMGRPYVYISETNYSPPSEAPSPGTGFVFMDTIWLGDDF